MSLINVLAILCLNSLVLAKKRMAPLMDRVEELLDQVAGGKYRRIIKHREYLWTFVHDQSVKPTNNAAERIARQAFLWHKSSFGTQSKRGARYVERISAVSYVIQILSNSRPSESAG